MGSFQDPFGNSADELTSISTKCPMPLQSSRTQRTQRTQRTILLTGKLRTSYRKASTIVASCDLTNRLPVLLTLVNLWISNSENCCFSVVDCHSCRWEMSHLAFSLGRHFPIEKPFDFLEISSSCSSRPTLSRYQI